MISPEMLLKVLDCFLGIVSIYLISSLMVGVVTYCRISSHILHRHRRVLTGKTIVKIFALTESLYSAIKLSPEWITMKSGEIEHKLDEKFCPTYLI